MALNVFPDDRPYMHDAMFDCDSKQYSPIADRTAPAVRSAPDGPGRIQERKQRFQLRFVEGNQNFATAVQPFRDREPPPGYRRPGLDDDPPGGWSAPAGSERSSGPIALRAAYTPRPRNHRDTSRTP